MRIKGEPSWHGVASDKQRILLVQAIFELKSDMVMSI